MLVKFNQGNWIQMKNKYGFKEESAIIILHEKIFDLGKAVGGGEAKTYSF